MIGGDSLEAAGQKFRSGQLGERSAAIVAPPRPGVAQPQLRQQIDRCRLGSVIGDGDRDADVVGRRFRIRDLNVEEPVLVQDPGIGQFVFAVVSAASGTLLAQVRVRILRMRVAVEPLHPTVRRSAVDRPEVLLDVLAVIPLLVGQPEESFLQNRILAIPQGEREIQETESIADSTDSVLTPAVGTLVRLIERKRRPRVSVLGVVFAHRAPLPSRQIRAPLTPWPADPW